MGGRKILVLLCLAMLFVALTGCRSQILDGDGMERSYFQISQEEAAEMMQKDDGHLIVDVRTREEYARSHIPGAICLPNEEIGNTQPEALPDLNQTLLVYCRSGRRSKEAAQKLFDIGYTNVYEFGGIIDWTGDLVSGEETE